MTDEEYAEIQAKAKMSKEIFDVDNSFNEATLDMLKDEFERVSSLKPSKDFSEKAHSLAETLIAELVMYQLKSGDEGEYLKALLFLEKKDFFIKQLAKCFETDLKEDVE